MRWAESTVRHAVEAPAPKQSGRHPENPDKTMALSDLVELPRIAKTRRTKELEQNSIHI